MRFIGNRLLLFRPLPDAGILATSVLILLLLADAAVPAAIAAGLAFLVGQLAETPQAAVSAALTPLIVFGAILIVGHIAEALAAPLEFLVQSRIDGAHRARMARMAMGTTSIGPLETPRVQSLIRQAKSDPEGGSEFTPGDGVVAQLRWLASLCGAAAVCVILARYSLWLIPLVAVPAVANRMLRSRRFFVIVDRWRFATKEELHADVWRKATVSPSEGKDVRIFGLADWMVRRMQQHIATANAPLWDYRMFIARNQWMQFLLVLLGLVPAYLLVTLSVTGGTSTTAVQAAVLAAGWSMFQMLGSAGDLYRMAGGVEVLTAAAELDTLLSEPHMAREKPVIGARPPLISFEGVGFRYPGTERPVLEHLDLQLHPGELLAIVGMNGAGKSTLIKLLTRLYEPTSGKITADGQDIAQLDPQLWRRRISVVFQDFVKYPLSAADNVALGTAARPEQLDAAATASGFTEVLSGLADGWDTPLARSRTGGVDLSGGQWQQVVLTRALYAAHAEARVLLLDEPTAHLDVRTEFEVFQRLAEHRGETGVVLISHRLSTVRQADRIVLLDNGRICESGSHDELIALNGQYAQMFAIQAERFQQGYDDRMEQELV